MSRLFLPPTNLFGSQVPIFGLGLLILGALLRPLAGQALEIKPNCSQALIQKAPQINTLLDQAFLLTLEVPLPDGSAESLPLMRARADELGEKIELIEQIVKQSEDTGLFSISREEAKSVSRLTKRLRTMQSLLISHIRKHKEELYLVGQVKDRSAGFRIVWEAFRKGLLRDAGATVPAK